MLFLNREKFAREKIPTLAEAVEECLRLQLTIYFDVKGHPDEVLPANNKLLCKVQLRAEIADCIYCFFFYKGKIFREISTLMMYSCAVVDFLEQYVHTYTDWAYHYDQ